MEFLNGKQAATSVLKHWEASKGNKEINEKPNWKEAPLSAMAKGGVAGEAEQQEDPDHMQALEAHSEEMHNAMKEGDFPRHAKAMKAFLHEHSLHEESKKKDVDNGPVSDKKDSKKVAIATDEYR